MPADLHKLHQAVKINIEYYFDFQRGRLCKSGVALLSMCWGVVWSVNDYTF